MESTVNEANDIIYMRRRLRLNVHDRLSGFKYKVQILQGQQSSSSNTEGKVTSRDLWLRHDRHFVETGGEDLSCYSHEIQPDY